MVQGWEEDAAGGSHEARGSVCLCVHARVHACTCAFSFNLVCVQAPSLERPHLSVYSLEGRVGAEGGSEEGPGPGPGGDALARGAGPSLTGAGPIEPFPSRLGAALVLLSCWATPLRGPRHA